MAGPFLSALLRAAARIAGPNRPPPTPEPEPEIEEPDWLEATSTAPDFARYPVDGFLRLKHWLDVSHSTNVTAIQWDHDAEELNVIYHGGGAESAWTYGDVTPEEAYALATAVAQGITPLGNLSTSGKGVWLWDAVRRRGPGNRHAHQKPARPNPGLVARWEAFRGRA